MVTDYPVPRGVLTSMTLHELRLLQRYAAVAGTVLEIGTLYGFSAIGMALAGVHVTSVDPHTNGTSGEADTWEAFLHNCIRHGYTPTSIPEQSSHCWLAGPSQSHINAYRQAVEEWHDDEIELRELGETPGFGMTLIDGDHGGEAPLRDGRIALAHLREPGYLAFHDMRPNFPAVLRATHLLEEEGTIRRLEQAGSLVVYQARLT